MSVEKKSRRLVLQHFQTGLTQNVQNTATKNKPAALLTHQTTTARNFILKFKRHRFPVTDATIYLPIN
jgi:hypothetical protein